LINEENEDDDDKDHEGIWINNDNDIEWKPEFDALFRYGAWLTKRRHFFMRTFSNIIGSPKNFVGELLLHLANSQLVIILENC